MCIRDSQIADLRRVGVEIVLVSSGAVTAGRERLPVLQRRRDMPLKQLLAAAGSLSPRATRARQRWTEGCRHALHARAARCRFRRTAHARAVLALSLIHI